MNKDIFLSKNNTINLFKNIVSKNNLNKLTKQDKQKIVQVIIKNMKKIFKSIDLKKINKSNYKSILEQFNSLTLNESIENIKDMKLIKKPSLSQRKYNRDFNSHPKREIQYMNRPDTSYQMSDQDNNLDNYFKTMNRETDNQFFDNKKSIADKMQRLQAMRSNTHKRQIRETPDYIQSKPTQETELEYNNRVNSGNLSNVKELDSFSDNSFSSINNISSNAQFNTNKFSDKSSFDDRLQRLQSERNILSKEMSSNSDDISNSLTNQNQMNSNNIRDQQIMKLKNDYDLNSRDLQMQQMQQQMQQQMNNQEIVPINNNKSLQNKIQQQQALRIQVNPNERFQQKLENDELERQRLIAMKNKELEDQRLKQFAIQNKLENQMAQIEQNLQKQVNEIKNEEEDIDISKINKNVLKNIPTYKVDDSNYSEINNIIKKNRQEYTTIIKKLVKKIEVLTNTNENEKNKYKSTIYDLQKDKEKLIKNKENLFRNIQNKKVKELMLDINEKFSELKEEKDNFTKYKNKVKLKGKEYDEKIDKIEKMVKILKNRINIKTIGIEVASNENLSEYKYEFNKLDNIIGIKLISYSLPNSSFNINENINNTMLIQMKMKKIIRNVKKIVEKTDNNEIINYNENEESYELDNEDTESEVNEDNYDIYEYEISLDSGYYTIQNLLDIINDKFRKIHVDINFSLDSLTQMVSVKSRKEFKILNNTLASDILGFNDVYNFSNSVIANKRWDLRIPDKLYLYLKNIQEDIPFSIVYFNKINQSEVKFKNPISIDNLDIKFLDITGNLYNFNDLRHILNFEFEILEKKYDIEDIDKDLKDIKEFKLEEDEEDIDNEIEI